MLEVSAMTVEAQLGVDSADRYANSSLYRRNQELIGELDTPKPGSKDLYFPTQYSQSFITQCKACLWKQTWSYWWNWQYNTIRFFMTVVIGLMFLKTSDVDLTPEPPMMFNALLKKYMVFEYDFLGPVVFSHVGFVLLFFFVFAYGIKFLNFQRKMGTDKSCFHVQSDAYILVLSGV